MRKLEGVVKELTDELNYLKVREERFSQTNGNNLIHRSIHDSSWINPRVYTHACPELLVVHHTFLRRARRLADSSPALVLQAQVPDRLM
jgi:hypothetical protein